MKPVFEIDATSLRSLERLKEEGGYADFAEMTQEALDVLAVILRHPTKEVRIEILKKGKGRLELHVKS